MGIDTRRHNNFFDPNKFQGRIDVIGAGATGSAVIQELVRYGFSPRVWDGDVVEKHNIANQKYVSADIGSLKVQAAAVMAREISGTELLTEPRKCTNQDTSLGEYVFLLTDTMSSRIDLASAIKKSSFTKLLIETRLGEDEGWIYVIEPRKNKEWAEWRNTLKLGKNTEDGSEYAEPSACGGKTVIGAVASMLAAQSVLYMLQYMRFAEGVEDITRPPHETVFGVAPLTAYTRFFQEEDTESDKGAVQACEPASTFEDDLAQTLVAPNTAEPFVEQGIRV